MVFFKTREFELKHDVSCGTVQMVEVTLPRLKIFADKSQMATTNLGIMAGKMVLKNY